MRQVRAGSKRGFDENQNGHAKMPKFDSEVFQFLFHRELIYHSFCNICVYALNLRIVYSAKKNHDK